MKTHPRFDRTDDFPAEVTGSNDPRAPLGLERPTVTGPVTGDHNRCRYEKVLSSQLRDSLLRMGDQRGWSLDSVLLAAVKTLLHRYSGEDEIAIGTSCGSGGWMAICSNLSDNPAFDELRRRVEGSESAKHNGHAKVCFSLSETLPTSECKSKCDLRFAFVDSDGCLTLYLDCIVGALPSANVVRISENLQTLLMDIVANPNAKVSNLSLLSEAERQRLLTDWNDTRAEYPDRACIHQLFELQAKRTPDTVAVCFDGQTLTYDELNRKANQLAHFLREDGVQPNDFVGICVERSFDTVISMLAVLKSGGAYVALHPRDPDTRLTYMLEESRATLVLTQQQWSARLSRLSVDPVCLDGDRTAIGEQPDSDLLECGDPDNLAYLVFTSGSTGKPKGVINSHRGVTNYLTYLHNTFELGSDDVVLQLASLPFDASIRDILGPLTAGARIQLIREAESKDPAAMLRYICCSQVTCILSVVPTVLNALVEAADRQSLRSALRLIVASGEALPLILCRKVNRVFGDDVLVVNQYGPTECTMTSTCFPVTNEHTDFEIASIGRPIQNCRVHVLDKYLNLAPIGAAGEVCIGGVGVTRGYLNRPELTQEKFISDPFSADPRARLYRTGDIACYLPDGNLQFLGRRDDQVKIGGVRIELKEIESQLLKHSGIKAAAVVVRDYSNDRMLIAKQGVGNAGDSGVQDKRLVGYVVSCNGTSTRELRDHLKESLPAHMIPTRIVQVDSLPMTANGKLDVKALPDPQSTRPALPQDFVAPRNSREQLIADIWKNLFRIDRIGVDDNFFDLGGDSLIGLQILNRVKQTTNQTIGFDSFFESPTVATLAKLVQEDAASLATGEIPQAPSSGDGKYPLTIAQEGVWFLWNMEPKTPYYTSQALIELRGDVDLEVLQESWIALFEVHEAMRARFDQGEGPPFQTFAPVDEACCRLPVTDLSHLPADLQKCFLRDAAGQEVEIPFDLRKGPLVRAQLFKLAENEYGLLRTMHEIAVDLWSVRVMMRDLSTLYHQISLGTGKFIESKQVRFRDYVCWERENIDRDKLQSQANYWREKLSGSLPVLALPTDRPRPHEPSYRSSSIDVLLSEELSQKLNALSRTCETTLFTTLLSAFNVLLHRYTGQDDVIIGAPLANRSRQETEDLVGFFLNMLPLRSDLSDNLSFLELLSRVRETVNGALSNADYPFSWMVEWAKIPRDPSISPVFQVMFNMFNYSDSSIESETLEMAYRGLETGYTKYDLSLYAQQQGSRVSLQICYQTDLFERETIERMLTNFTVLLENIAADPERPVDRLRLLNDSEEKTLLRRFNNTDRDYKNDKCLHVLFEEQAAKTPAATALVFDGVQLSYAELNERSNRLAHHLRMLGVKEETPVAVCVDRSFGMVAALLGVMKAGGTYVALEPTYPLLRLKDIIGDVQPPFMVLENEQDRFEDYQGEKVLIQADGTGIENVPSSNPPPVTTPASALNIVFSSGSTGKPKGAIVTMEAVLNRLFWMWDEYPFRSEDVAVFHKSYALVAATWECFGALLRGFPTVIASRQDVLDPAVFWKLLVDHDVSYLLATPPLLGGVLEQAEAQPSQRHRLRLATTSAERIPPQMVNRWRKVFPDVPLLNLYGSTECSSNVTVYDTREMPHDAIRVPIGKPLPNTRVYLLDQHGSPVPIGVVGQMCVAGACVTRGYHNRAELNQEKFDRNPFSEQADSILYRTGDLARYRRDGTLELVGREDHQAKIRGFRVELQEIELLLCNHPAVREAVVIARAEESSGEASSRGIGNRLIAYLVPREGQTPTVDELRGRLRKRLPEYMLPSAFVMLNELPRLPSGKVDRGRLPEPDSSRPEFKRELQPPSNSVERRLVEIWEKVLNVRPIGVTDNYFELGGHSIQAVYLFNLINKHFGRQLPLATLFETPTIANLAALLSSDELLDFSSLVPVQPNGSRPPLFFVHDHGGEVISYRDLARRLGDDQPFFGLRAKMHDGASESPADIEQMAADYIEELRRIQPRGPYFIGGWCMGGVIALEIAQQLKSQGQQVALLTMIHSVPPAYSVHLARFGPLRRLLFRGINRADQEISSLREEEGVKKLSYLIRRMGQTVTIVRIQCEKAVGRVLSFINVGLPNSDAYLMRKRGAEQLHTYVKYEPRPFDGEVLLLRAAKQRIGAPSDPTLGWGELMNGNLSVKTFPGHRSNLLCEPRVCLLAEELRRCLEQASRQNEQDVA